MTGARKRGLEMEDKEERYNRGTINNLLSGMVVEILEIMTED